ncbi:MAG: anthranilate synthase component II [Akkermansiaceae bacterium]
MLLVIDNYDSFTYNLVQYFGELGSEMKVVRNDAMSIDEIRDLAPERICISPGPCTPNEAGVSCDVIREFGKDIPILGVCLGHQSIGQVFGGEVVRAERLMHGKTSQVFHTGKSVFEGLQSPLTATRYHSLVVKRDTLPDCLEITAETKSGTIMGLMHRDYPIHGVQFHPESILTDDGMRMLGNFLSIS